MKKYIHYGSHAYLPELFCDIHNTYMSVKPTGGLWASPVDANFGWKDWCKESGARDCKEENSFTFTLAENAKVYHIYSVSNLLKLPQKRDANLAKCIDQIFLDFEAIKNSGIDAIELHLSEEKIESVGSLGNRLYYTLYGWDCDSILIMNPDIIVPCE